MDVLSDKLIKRVGERLCKKHNMCLIGIGGGAPKGKLDHIGVDFDRSVGPISIEKCRELIVDCIKTYLEEINSNEELRSYLITYPYNSSNVYISILNSHPNGDIVLFPDICSVSSCRKGIYYSIRDKSIGPFLSETFETYEEALAKLQPQDVSKKDIQIFTDFTK